MIGGRKGAGEHQTGSAPYLSTSLLLSKTAPSQRWQSSNFVRHRFLRQRKCFFSFGLSYILALLVARQTSDRFAFLGFFRVLHFQYHLQTSLLLSLISFNLYWLIKFKLLQCFFLLGHLQDEDSWPILHIFLLLRQSTWKLIILLNYWSYCYRFSGLLHCLFMLCCVLYSTSVHTVQPGQLLPSFRSIWGHDEGCSDPAILQSLARNRCGTPGLRHPLHERHDASSAFSIAHPLAETLDFSFTGVNWFLFGSLSLCIRGSRYDVTY
jgi:hypothetical protein